MHIRPGQDASLSAWLAYHQQRTALYAEIDRGHHHDCLYWTERKQESAQEVMARIRAKGSKQRCLFDALSGGEVDSNAATWLLGCAGRAGEATIAGPAARQARAAGSPDVADMPTVRE